MSELIEDPLKKRSFSQNQPATRSPDLSNVGMDYYKNKTGNGATTRITSSLQPEMDSNGFAMGNPNSLKAYAGKQPDLPIVAKQENPVITDYAAQMQANNERGKETGNGIINSLEQSSRDFTGRVVDMKDKGVIGGVAQLGKEILGGIGNMGRAFNEQVSSSIDAYSPYVAGSNNATHFSDPLAANSTAPATAQTVTQAGNQTSTPDPAPTPAGIIGAIPEKMARQTDFNDGNYDPASVTTNTPMQSQIANPQADQIAELTKLATMKISNSMDIGKRGALIAQRKAAQQVLGTVVSADTADKNRANTYESDQRKSVLKARQDQAKEFSKSRAFTADSLDVLDLDSEAKFKLSTVTKSDWNEARDHIKTLSKAQRNEALASGSLDGTFGLTGQQLMLALGLDQEQANG